MRILLVVRSCQGGMKNHVANLVAGLTEQGHQVFVAGGQTDVDWRGANLPLSANPIQFWSCTYILSSLITELAPDVVDVYKRQLQ